jgi:hypothetical protein
MVFPFKLESARRKLPEMPTEILEKVVDIRQS